MPAKRPFSQALAVGAVAVLLALSSLLGALRQQSGMLEMLAEYAGPADYRLERINSERWQLLDQEGNSMGELRLGEGRGYNGPVGVVVKTSSGGEILDVGILYHSETPSYVQKLYRRGYLGKLAASTPDQLRGMGPADAVSGATLSSQAVLQGAQAALGMHEDPHVRGSFSGLQTLWPALLIVLAFALAWALPRIRPSRLQKAAYWLLLVFSLVYLGFAQTQMLSLSRFAALLSCYFPNIWQQLPFYVLLGGSLILVFAVRRNLYCQSICPFGAAQEVTGRIGGAKAVPQKLRKPWKWLQWGVALAVLCLALILNNPGLARYEVFGAFFQLTGNALLFGLLIVTVVASLFYKRPWCRFLCPVDGVFAFFKALRAALGR